MLYILQVIFEIIDKTSVFMYNLTYGEIPKRLKGSVSKTDRGESLQGFKSPFLRQNRL